MKNKLVLIFSGLVLGFSCIYPDNFLAPLSVFILCVFYFLKIKKISAKDFFIVGLFFHLTSMWWLWPTMEKFGDMPSFAAFFLMLLHSVLSSVQFYLVSLVSKKISFKINEKNAFVILWIIAELYFPRMFPWTLGNFFIIITPLSSYAEILGVIGVSLIVLIFAHLISFFIDNFTQNIFRYNFVKTCMALLPFCILIIGGSFLNFRASEEIDKSKPIAALVVQGNLSIEEKGKQEFLKVNLDRYKELSNKIFDEKVDFIIWPESVFSAWLNLETLSYNSLDGDTLTAISKPLLYGGLAYVRTADDAKMYNAALLWQNSTISSQYYAKRILMPFGEYVPFASTFPLIRKFTPIDKDFSMGEVLSPIKIELAEGKIVNAGVSICYEDLSSNLSRQIVKNGAQVLVNLTNDAWYGDSPAPFQHDLLARFRAIETRRYLVRSTNTGFTTLTDPFGKIIDKIQLFQSDAKVFTFFSLNRTTLYVQYGDFPLLCLFALYLIISCYLRKSLLLPESLQ
jgi:apolipoprotein N-acyltransferase